MSKVYIKVDAQERVVDIASDEELVEGTAGWTEIDEGEGLKYEKPKDYYLLCYYKDVKGRYVYRWDGTEAVQRTEEELDAEEEAERAKAMAGLTQDDLVEMLLEQEYRIVLMEMGM